MKCEYCRDLDTLKERVCESLLNPSTLTRITSIEFTSILLSHTPAASGKKSTFDSTRFSRESRFFRHLRALQVRSCGDRFPQFGDHAAGKNRKLNSRKEIRDDAFDYRFVEMMSLILLTSAETVSLRNRLRGCAYWRKSGENANMHLFDILYLCLFSLISGSGPFVATRCRVCRCVGWLRTTRGRTSSWKRSLRSRCRLVSSFRQISC